MLNVDLSIRDSDGQAVVALRGQLSLADTPGVASHLIAAVAACGPSVIVDMAGLDGIGYIGLSVLLRVRKWTRRNGGDLPLAAPQQPVRRILEATGLIDVFSVHPSVEEAANSIRQVRVWSPAAPLAAPCRDGYPIWLPAAGVPCCPSSPGPATAQARNVPVSTSCAACLCYAALAGRDKHDLSRLIRWSRGRQTWPSPLRGAPPGTAG